MSDTTATATLPKVCAECGKRTNKVNRSLDNPDLCNKCFEIAGLENGHADGHHDDHFEKGCPDCDEEKANDQGEIDPIRYEEPEGICRYCRVVLTEDNTAEAFTDVCKDCDEKIPGEGASPNLSDLKKQAHFDHSACDHPKSPKARAQCRKTGPASVFHGVLTELPQDDTED